MTGYTYEKVVFNGISGWFCTRRINGLYAGKRFGRTKKDARENFGGES